VCASFANNDGNSHSFTVNAAISADIPDVTYTGNTGQWVSSPVSPGTAQTVAANQTVQVWINASGAAHVAVIVAGGSGTGSVDVVFSQSGSACTGSGVNSNGSVCNNSAVQTVAVSTTVTLVAAPPAGQMVHVCAYAVGGDVATNGTLVQFSYGATCAGVGTVVWQVSPHTGGSNYNQGAGLGQLFQTRTAAQPLCVTQGASGATQFVSVSFIIF
jgi:hypothetical protein